MSDTQQENLLRSSPPRPSSSSQWTAEDAKNYLSVRYVRAPFGQGMVGKTVHEAYLNLLHDSESEQALGAPSSMPSSSDTCARGSIGRPSNSIPTTLSTGPGYTRPKPRNSAGILSYQARATIDPWDFLTYTARLQAFTQLFEVLSEFDVNASSSGIFYSGKIWKKLIVHCHGDEEQQKHIRDSGDVDVDDEDLGALPPKLKPIADAVNIMNQCFEKLKRERQNLMNKGLTKVYTVDYCIECGNRFDRLKKFMNVIAKLLRRSSGLSFCKMDGGIFTQIFTDFAWIFDVQFSVVTAFKPLIVCGQELSSIPDLMYDLDKEWNMSIPQNILIITVVEVKKDVPVKTPPYHEHELRKRKFSDPELYKHEPEEDEDSAYLPEDLRGQHACQLVRALPHTYAPNKNCMLGFTVQATKVRLTCLIMEKDHLDSIKLPDFNPGDYSATIYYTRSYDMLNAADRYHLIRIMVTLATLGGGDVL